MSTRDPAASPFQPVPRLAGADVTARLKQLSGLRDEGQRLVNLSFAQTAQGSPQALLDTGQVVVSSMAGFRTLAAAGFVEPQPSVQQQRSTKVETALRHLQQLQDRAEELLTPTRAAAAGADP